MLDVDALSEMMAGIISEEVEKAVAPLRAELEELRAREPEKGEPGEKGDPGERGEKGEPGQDGKDGSDGLNGKDAAGIAAVVKDQGELVLTLEDGRLVRTGIRDGEKGQDGRDGFNLEDFDVEAVDERTIKLKFQRGDTLHSFELEFPVIIDAGVFKEGTSYKRGEAVTWGGSLWIAQKETSSKPDTAESGWRLAVKKGRDGKDAKNG
jgi:hypothetical protein